jgi:hypothetical protein
MRLSFAAAVVWVSLQAPAQETKREDRTTYVYDLDGKRTVAARSSVERSPGQSRRTERVESVNGRLVPLETAEERLIAERPGERIVEILVRRYDQDGRPGPPEKVLREERTGPAGERTVRTTVQRGDLNGRFTVAERSTTRTTQVGDVLTSETLVERPSLGGSFEVFEKRAGTETLRPDGVSREVTVHQAGADGGLRLVARESTEILREQDRETTKTTRYNTAATGRLTFAEETVSEIERRADGSEVSLLSVYGVAPAGRPAGDRHLREQQLIERSKGPGGEVVERFSIRRPSLSDRRLGRFEPVSEIVCTGNCEEDNSGGPRRRR